MKKQLLLQNQSHLTLWDTAQSSQSDSNIFQSPSSPIPLGICLAVTIAGGGKRGNALTTNRLFFKAWKKQLYCSSWIREVRLRTATIYRWNSSTLSHHHDHLLVLEKHLNATNSEQSPSAPRFAPIHVRGGRSLPGALAVWGAETVTVIKNVFSQSVACHLLTLNTLASKHGPAAQ